MNDMRDRLIELLKSKYDHYCDQCGVNKDSQYIENLADHLLANGVIVPPCKVGDFVVWKAKNEYALKRIKGFYYNPNDLGLRYDLDDCSPIINHENIKGILTKNDIERVLAERMKSNDILQHMP